MAAVTIVNTVTSLTYLLTYWRGRGARRAYSKQRSCAAAGTEKLALTIGRRRAIKRTVEKIGAGEHTGSGGGKRRRIINSATSSNSPTDGCASAPLTACIGRSISGVSWVRTPQKLIQGICMSVSVSRTRRLRCQKVLYLYCVANKADYMNCYNPKLTLCGNLIRHSPAYRSPVNLYSIVFPKVDQRAGQLQTS